MSNGTDIRSFIEAVQLKRFASEPIKQEVKPTSGGFSIACPYCGDSKTNPNNFRGNVYMSTKTYKCFNDGCMKWATLVDFVSHWAIATGIDVMNFDIDYEPLVSYQGIRKKIEEVGKNRIANYVRDEGLMEQLPAIEGIIDRLMLIPLSSAPEYTRVHKVMMERCLDHLPDMDNVLYTDGTYDRIYIFNTDEVSGRVLSFAIRNTHPKLEKFKKYDAYTFSRMMEKLCLPGKYQEVELIDAMGHYFNIMNVDFSRDVKVVEGQIDSMFIDNCVAATGVSKIGLLLEFVDHRCVKMLFDNDKAGRVSAVESMSNGMQTFMWAVLIERMLRIYHRHKKEIHKIKDINNLYVFMKGIWDGMTRSMFNDMLERYYSNNQYDICNI